MNAPISKRPGSSARACAVCIHALNLRDPHLIHGGLGRMSVFPCSLQVGELVLHVIWYIILCHVWLIRVAVGGHVTACAGGFDWP
jgi:hypothetical protein